MADRPAPLAAVLAVTFFGSVSGGVYWAAIFFVTAHHYGFSPARNLVLAMFMGIVYIIAARAAGPLTRRAAENLRPRTILATALAAWTAAALAPIALAGAETILWVGALLGAAASAVTWPVVESYLAAGRHGSDMRRAIGCFNVTWTPAVALALLLMPAVGRANPLGPLALAAAGSLVALAAAFALPPRPGHHAPEAAAATMGREYVFLAHATAWLLPGSYVLASALAPLLPHRLATLDGARRVPDGVVAALWMVARFFVLAGMGRSHFWHGRWETLAVAAGALAGGFALALLGASTVVLAAGLILFGVGMAITYYASLYYSLAVGRAAVDAGGNFEALIGVGYVLGPLLGLAGYAASSAHSPSSTTVALAWVATAVTCAGAVRWYLAARVARRLAAERR